MTTRSVTENFEWPGKRTRLPKGEIIVDSAVEAADYLQIQIYIPSTTI